MAAAKAWNGTVFYCGSLIVQPMELLGERTSLYWRR